MNSKSIDRINSRPHLILIGGGSAAGKTLLADMIKKNFAGNDITIISQDSYYKDLSHLSSKEIKKYNFDHPNAIDHTDLIKDVHIFLTNKKASIPQYDFISHTRKEKRLEKKATDVVILEGIFALHYNELAKLADLRIFVDTDEDLRLIRRLKRDTNDRGRTMESVLSQYVESVKPMHHNFVEPSKQNADIIIPGNKSFDKALQMLEGYLLSHLVKSIGN